MKLWFTNTILRLEDSGTRSGGLRIFTLVNQPSPKAKTLQTRILTGSAMLLSGSGFTALLSFAYNIAVARLLGPADFGHAAAIYTILFLFSSVMLSFQIVGAKVAAQQDVAETRDAAYRDYHRSAWIFGIAVAAFLLILRKGITEFLNVPSPTLVVLIAIGIAFYIPLGSRRGYVQGVCSFGKLAWNMVLENAIRLVGAVLLILLGAGVTGVIAANSVAVIVAYFALAPKLSRTGQNPLGLSLAMRELLTALIFFSGVAIINNSGIVLVKHYFSDIEAGLYAAVAMVGRVIFALASAVVNSTFPIIAGAQKEDRKNPRLVLTSLLLVLGIGLIATICLRLAPVSVWNIFLGSGFEIGGANRLSYLMPLYAIMTTIYSLSAVIITYEMSYKVAGASWIQLGFSGLVVASICLFHHSLQQVIYIQTGLMIVLLVAVGTPFVFSFAGEKSRENSGRPIKRIRRVSVDEVIGGFLKSDFDLSLYRDYQEKLGELVYNPDYDNDGDNAIRRALLFLRHRPIWTQVPAESEWYEVEIAQPDLKNIRVFPRAQWARLAKRDFSLERVIARLISRTGKADESLYAKIAFLRRQFLRGGSEPLGAVLLLALTENGPFTVLDGNHRFVAAALDSPFQAGKLRFFCAFSPRMSRCCWCRTNLYTLVLYAFSRVAVATHNSKAELKALLDARGLNIQPAQTAVNAETPRKRQTESKEEAVMASSVPDISVIEAPDHAGNRKAQRIFLKQIEPCIEVKRPRIVLDCSKVRKFDRAFVHLVLCCLEEAMKRNGDVRLAGIPPEARAVLDITGATHLFEIFDNVEEAESSFRPLWNSPQWDETRAAAQLAQTMAALPNALGQATPDEPVSQ